MRGFFDKTVLLTKFYDFWIIYGSPANFSYWWNFGSMVLICLIIQIAIGIFLVMHYKSDLNLAFASVDYISKSVQYGWLIINIRFFLNWVLKDISLNNKITLEKNKFINQKKFYKNSIILLNRILAKRYYCMMFKTLKKGSHQKDSLQYVAVKATKQHPTIDNFVKDVVLGDIYYVKISTTTCNNSGGPLLSFNDFYGKSLYLYNGKKGILIQKIKTIEDLNLVKNLINDYTADLLHTKILNTDIVKEIVQTFVIKKIKVKEKIDVEYINKNVDNLEDMNKMLNKIEQNINNNFENKDIFLSIKKTLD